MKGALLVGIDNYPEHENLFAAIKDATSLDKLLSRNGDGSSNFQVDLRTKIRTRSELRKMIIKLFNADLHTALFYFAGHGCINERGGYIVTPDFKEYDEGISMDEILNIVNHSAIREKIVILDCCHAGSCGTPVIIGGTASFLGEGVTILSACRPYEEAEENSGMHGVFTSLLLNALEGGAADIAGNISPGNIYAYIDRSLGFLDQRPLYKANVSRFISLRNTEPLIKLETLRKIKDYFTTASMPFPLDPTYEYTNTDIAVPEHVAVFQNLQKMQSLGLIIPVGEEFMYWAAQNSKACKLTSLGKHYWSLVKKERI